MTLALSHAPSENTPLIFTRMFTSFSVVASLLSIIGEFYGRQMPSTGLNHTVFMPTACLGYSVFLLLAVCDDNDVRLLLLWKFQSCIIVTVLPCMVLTPMHAFLVFRGLRAAKRLRSIFIFGLIVWSPLRLEP